MKTLKQIAKENKVSKQQVYRIYKSEIESLHEAHQVNGVIHLDESDENIILERLHNKTISKSHQEEEIKHFNEVHQEEETKQFDEADKSSEKQGFSEKTTSKSHQEEEMKHFGEALQKQMIDILHEQLKTKDRQIEELNQRLAEAQELQRANQVLLHQQKEKSKLVENVEENSREEKQEVEIRKGFWKNLFK
ncbi:hypothetical protein [Proteocatella sphenisci]|uniref:hypothetical protein n=1 Tax=Proteocatella sphenisci TaxID=181070 RepID=UPI00048EE230|nr:hypothetical protein [Proteocatella sphenisci]